MATKTNGKTPSTKPATETKAPAKKATEPKTKAERIERNGVKAPTGRPGVVFAIWSLLEEHGKKIGTADLPALAEEHGWNLPLLRSWHRQWRKFNGLPVGRPTKAAEPEVKKATAKKAA